LHLHQQELGTLTGLAFDVTPSTNGQCQLLMMVMGAVCDGVMDADLLAV